VSKINVGILFGGKSAEHAVSVISATSVIKRLDYAKYDVTPIYIDINASWHSLGLISEDNINDNVLDEIKKITKKIRNNINDGGHTAIDHMNFDKNKMNLDVIFPLLHGTLGEDGAIQGVLELLDIPYISCGILSSAITMDKEITKKLLQHASINVTPFVTLREHEYRVGEAVSVLEKKLLQTLQFPLFVKPSNSGSSIGITKAEDANKLHGAIEEAFKYDQKILIEQAIVGKEIEVSVLENIDNYDDPIVSYPGRVIPNNEFYTYKAKYIMNDGARFELPAKLSKSIENLIREQSGKIFKILECNCLSRVDFFLEEKTNILFFNEINTLPGFTEISLYPKLLEYYGIQYEELLNKLIHLAIKKHHIKKGKTDNAIKILSEIESGTNQL
jgi:D-alanine-D-alanine ligase